MVVCADDVDFLSKNMSIISRNTEFLSACICGPHIFLQSCVHLSFPSIMVLLHIHKSILTNFVMIY